MNFRNQTMAIITISLLAALAILAVSFLLEGDDTAQTITYLIIALWWIPYSILAARKSGK